MIDNGDDGTSWLIFQKHQMKEFRQRLSTFDTSIVTNSFHK